MHTDYGADTARGALARQDQPRDRSQVDIHLEQVCRLADEAFELQHVIESRLGPILRPTPPTTASQTGKPSEVLVPLADTLSQKANTLDSLVAMQRDLLSRIEL